MIYYVEDDENIRGLALYALKQAGLDALGFEDGESFFQEVDKNKCALILLDIMLPGTDGLTLLSEIRANKQISNTPVMMLSAKGTEYDKVSALDAGADDYLAKPFGMMELVSRCKALLRRNGQIANSDDSTLRCGPIEINAAAHEARLSICLQKSLIFCMFWLKTKVEFSHAHNYSKTFGELLLLGKHERSTLTFKR